jgi:HD-like signal output (HDOD) protein
MSSTKTELIPYKNPPVEDRVRAILCADGKGQVQIVAPESALVDPEPIRASTARDLRSLPPAEDAPVCAIPGYYGLPSVVDAQLKDKAVVALATEVPGEYVRATGAQVHQLCLSHASFEAEFCAELVGTPQTRDADEAHIFRAIESFTTRRIEARLDETLVIPPLPETAQRIIALQQDPNFDLSDLVTIIESDPAVSARLMGWANSAFYGNGTPSKTLNDAIMRVLGFDLVFNMALGMSIGATLNLPASHVSGASPYWLDAVYTAATMEALARHSTLADVLNPGTCYLIGLLSNFGTLVIGHVFPPQYESICRLTEANPLIAYPYIDQHVLHLNREVIAASLLELWELPDEITTPVRFQNIEAYQGSFQSYVELLQLSQAILIHGAQHLPQRGWDQAEHLHIATEDLYNVVEAIAASQSELGELAQSMTQ